MQDHLIKVTVPGIRAFAAVTTELTEEVRKRHKCYPVATAAVGRTMTAALLLAANLKTTEALTIRIKGDGPIGELVADAYANGDVRGYVRYPQLILPLKDQKLDVGGAVGKGQIRVTRFMELKQPFTGTCDLVSGEIAEDITNYLAVSEQTPSSVALGVLVQPNMKVTAAGGFFLQVMPGAEEELIKKIEENLATLPPVSQIIANNKQASAMTDLLFAGLPATQHSEIPLRFNCRCSREKVHSMFISLGKKEVEEILTEDGQAEVSCHFCNCKYKFTRQDLENILASIETESKAKSVE